MEVNDLLKIIEFNIPDGKELKDITVEEVQDDFRTKYIGKNIAHEVDDIRNKILGKEWGTFETAFKRLAKELEIDVKDLGGKKEDIDKLTEALKIKVSAIKESAGKTKDQKLIELETEIEKYKSDYKTVLSQNETLQTELNTGKSEFESFKTNLNLNQKIEEARSKLAFSEKADKYVKKGFYDEFAEKYKVELSADNDSEDGLRITDKSGNRVSAGSKFMKLEDILNKELKEAGYLKLNNTDPDPNKKFKINGGEGEPKPVNKISDAAAAHAQALNAAK